MSRFLTFPETQTFFSCSISFISFVTIVLLIKQLKKKTDRPLNIHLKINKIKFVSKYLFCWKSDNSKLWQKNCEPSCIDELLVFMFKFNNIHYSTSIILRSRTKVAVHYTVISCDAALGTVVDCCCCCCSCCCSCCCCSCWRSWFHQTRKLLDGFR